MFPKKSCDENPSTHFVSNNIFPPKIVKTMWKNTESIFAFSREQWLRKRAIPSRCTYVTSLTESARYVTMGIHRSEHNQQYTNCE